MKEAILAALAAALFWTVLPLLTAGTAAPVPPAAEETIPQTEPTRQTVPETETESSPGQAQEEAEGVSVRFDETFFLPVLTGQGVRTMDLHTYLTGALLAEMPMRFAPEARKAQAVACRTYALRSFGHPRHDGAAVCIDSGCCQGWTDPEQADSAARAAAEQAVSETDGLAVYYGEDLIDATFFSCSGGQTESAAAVWGSDLPYLQSVESPGEEDAAHFRDKLCVDLDRFCAVLRQEDDAVCFPAEKGGWVGGITYTPGGGVDTIVLGGRPFRGTRIRKLFSLRSTVFTLELTDTQAVFHTRGFGHRVGLSQYGAEAMAEEGADFIRILTWYYRGVTVRPVQADPQWTHMRKSLPERKAFSVGCGFVQTSRLRLGR